jgi:ATP-dependent RNA helicase RhlE
LGEEARTARHVDIAAWSEEISPLLHFSSMDLCQPILDAIAEEGYDTPTPIQAQAIPPVLAGRDLLGCAQTGTGKTAAFALPILHNLLSASADKKRRGPVLPRVLVLSPTRELACQIGESFSAYGRYTGLRGAVIYGGVSQFKQVRSLERGVDILVATPGRLMDLMEQGHVNLGSIQTFVLDEADRMLDMGFIQPIRRIASAIPAERQTLLFSATMPQNIMHLADSLLRDPVRVAVKPEAATTALIEQSIYMVRRESKPALIEHLLTKNGVDRALVFTRTKYGADKLTRKLTRVGVTATSIHGNKSQNQRQRALDSFRTGRSRVLVATDVAARGLDVDGITHVFNFDLPNEPEAYIHRIGRTGRAGAAGVAISFCDRDERGHLRAIERLTGERLATVARPAELQIEHSEGTQRTDNDNQSQDRPQRGEANSQRRRSNRPRRASKPAGSAPTGRGAGPRSTTSSNGPKRSARTNNSTGPRSRGRRARMGSRRGPA